MCDLEVVPKVEKQSPISVISRDADTDLDIGGRIYHRIDVNNLGASPISTGDLYDDALMGKMGLLEDSQNSKSTEPWSSQEMTEKEGTEKMNGSKMGVDEVIENLTPPNAIGQTQRRCAVYVGNLTWWTTHEQIVEAVKMIGVNDILDVKILDCRANGQSKGYCLLTLGSDASVKHVMEQLWKLEIHGRALVVKPDSKLTVAYFESQTICRPPFQFKQYFPKIACGDRSRRRTLEEPNRRHSSSELVERDSPRSKVSRLELGKDYFRR